MPFSHNGLKTTTGTCIQVFSQVNKYTLSLSYRFLYGNVQGCVLAKNRPVSPNWTDYNLSRSTLFVQIMYQVCSDERVKSEMGICMQVAPYAKTPTACTQLN